MTTNTIDIKTKILASDSRWSMPFGKDQIAYVDDTGFDKIADRKFASIICAGDAQLIEQWRNWFLTDTLDPEAMPATERVDEDDGKVKSVVLTVVQKPQFTIPISFGSYLIHEQTTFFSGTGSQFALACYAKNGCAKRSISSAAEVDPMTGGETKFVDIHNDTNNLSGKPASLADAVNQMDTRGVVMNTNTKKVISMKDFKALPENKGMSASALQLSAPTGQPYRAWTAEEKSSLKEAMEKIAELERQG